MTELEKLCVSHGLRLTDKQRLVFQAVQENDGRADVERVLASARQMNARISRGTVYRAIKLLRSAGAAIPR